MGRDWRPPVPALPVLASSITLLAWMRHTVLPAALWGEWQAHEKVSRRASLLCMKQNHVGKVADPRVAGVLRISLTLGHLRRTT